MYPAQFEYVVPKTLEEALQLLVEGEGESKLIAGGHSLLPMMKLRLAQPAKLIDISRLSGLGLKEIKVSSDGTTIGALVTHAQIAASPEIARTLPLLTEAAHLVGDLQVRNRGTLGGSLAHADPAGDLPAVFLALDGEIVARGPNGERTIKVSDFFVDILTTSLEETEIMTQVRVPTLAPKTGTAYRKFEHPASHYAMTGVAAVVTMGDGGKIQQARIGVTGVGVKAYRAEGVEQALVGQGADAVAQAAEKAADGIDCNDDIHASADYRAHLARVFTRRAIEAAISAAG